MKSFIIIITAVIIFGIQMYVMYKKRNKIVSMLPVEAGPTKGVGDFMTPEQVSVGAIDMNPELEYFTVRNRCMEERGIYSGDVIGVKMFDQDYNLNDTDENSVLLIYLEDKGFHGHKIRVRGHLTESNDAYATYYYMEDGSPHFSQTPHAFQNILGEVIEVNHLSN